MANFITFFRVFIAIIALSIMQKNAACNIAALSLITVTMLLDALDGFIARFYNTCSLNGSIYDILADRIIENIFFIYFAAFGLFSIWFALAIMIRGLIIDAIRTVFVAQGKTAFGESSFHTHPLAKTITCSKLSRGSYNTAKILIFVMFAALVVPSNPIFNIIPYETVKQIAELGLWLTLLLAIIRALPVIYEVRRIVEEIAGVR